MLLFHGIQSYIHCPGAIVSGAIGTLFHVITKAHIYVPAKKLINKRHMDRLILR